MRTRLDSVVEVVLLSHSVEIVVERILDCFRGTLHLFEAGSQRARDTFEKLLTDAGRLVDESEAVVADNDDALDVFGRDFLALGVLRGKKNRGSDEGTDEEESTNVHVGREGGVIETLIRLVDHGSQDGGEVVEKHGTRLDLSHGRDVVLATVRDESLTVCFLLFRFLVGIKCVDDVIANNFDCVIVVKVVFENELGEGNESCVASLGIGIGLRLLRSDGGRHFSCHADGRCVRVQACRFLRTRLALERFLEDEFARSVRVSLEMQVGDGGMEENFLSFRFLKLLHCCNLLRSGLKDGRH